LASFREDQIGSRIRALRISRGLTLAQVAEATKFSASYLSKLENSKSSPPISTLSAIAEALGTHIADIFADAEPETLITLVRKDQRHPASRQATKMGYSYTPLAPVFPNRLMDPYIIVIPAKPKNNQIFQHKGQEMLLVLTGRLEVFVGDQRFVLDPGDCLYFDATVPHHGHGLDGSDVEALMVMSSGGAHPADNG
jgi:transcriptional regulator with XRE-family HTH domain